MPRLCALSRIARLEFAVPLSIAIVEQQRQPRSPEGVDFTTSP